MQVIFFSYIDLIIMYELIQFSTGSFFGNCLISSVPDVVRKTKLGYITKHIKFQFYKQ
jgi:hypothetical protein